MLTLLLTSALLAPQVDQAASRPSSRPSSPAAVQDDRTRMVTADWTDDAPGQQVLRRGSDSFKFLPMKDPRYGSREDVADRVRDEDLVIGLVVGDAAFAYPINMLGGPQREIVNDEYGGVPFCVNW